MDKVFMLKYGNGIRGLTSTLVVCVKNVDNEINKLIDAVASLDKVKPEHLNRSFPQMDTISSDSPWKALNAELKELFKGTELMSIEPLQFSFIKHIDTTVSFEQDTDDLKILK